ncbi:MAG: hypothetical protein HY048_00285 [Acidobacteria bacterium]|nr:hypothetical protein [Acidobacteriota bacterium]
MCRRSRIRSEVGAGLSLAACLTLTALSSPASAQGKRSCEAIEAFMRSARMSAPRGLSVVMDDGTMQHRVFLHTSDEHDAPPGRFRDTWRATVAAYELTKILEINLMPPYVERSVDGTPVSISWGLDDVIMDDAQRIQRNVQPQDLEAWDRQMSLVRVFDELIYDGRAPSDLLITKDWQPWVIAPSQGFRPITTIQHPGNLVKCDRKLLGKLRTLDKDMLTRKLGNWLTPGEIDALHVRAGAIVALFDRKIAATGDAAVLFDLDRSGAPCSL